jgi:WD40 repeat protein
VYNRLRGAGWEPDRIERELSFPAGLPALRLRHPVRLGLAELTLSGHRAGIWACAIAPDGRRVVSASRDGTLRVWDVGTGEPLAVLEGHEREVRDCAITADGRTVVSASSDGTLRTWNLRTGRPKGTPISVGGRLLAFALTPDGRHVVSCHRGALTVWELETGALQATLAAEGVSGRVCVVSPDGRHVVASVRDTLTIWRLEAGEPITTIAARVHERHIRTVTFTPDSRTVIASLEDGRLGMWDQETGRERVTLAMGASGSNLCRTTLDGRVVLTASMEDRGDLRFWALDTAREVARVPLAVLGHEDIVLDVALTPDGQRAVSASWDGTLKVWKLAAALALPPDDHRRGAPVCACAMSPDGERAVSLSGEGTAVTWNVETGQVSAQVALAPMSSLVRGSLAPDGRTLFVRRGPHAEVWDLERGCRVSREATPADDVLAALKRDERWLCHAFTPDGRRVVFLTRTHLAAIDLATGGRLFAVAVSAPERPVAAMAAYSCTVACDGPRVVSLGLDGDIRLWSLADGASLGTLHGTVRFTTVAVGGGRLCATDVLGNVWFLDTAP